MPGGRRPTVRQVSTIRPRCRPADEAQRLIDLLSALGSTTFRRLLWHKAAALDLTSAQSQVLFHVAQHPGCHMGDVGKAFGVTLPAVTHIVDRLEQKGFLARGDHPVDRRVSVLELTAAGAKLVEDLHALQLGSVEPVLRRMSACDRDRVLKGLQALVEATRGAAGAPRDGAQRGRRRHDDV